MRAIAEKTELTVAFGAEGMSNRPNAAAPAAALPACRVPPPAQARPRDYPCPRAS
nr:hypothetical protein [Oleomonas cavernae]